MKADPNFSVKHFVRLLNKEGLDVDVSGKSDCSVTHLRNLESAEPGCLTFYIGEDSSIVSHLKSCALICRPEVIAPEEVTKIITQDPKLAFYIIAQSFFSLSFKSYTHPTAIIDPEAVIEANCYIGPYSVIGKCRVGEGVTIHSNVHLYDGTTIGARTVVESGTCIGVTGQIWAWGLNGKRWMMPQLGGVIVEADCFIGSNISIARGALQDTIIQKGARISHGSMIGHNCHIGKETFLSNRIAMSGSTVVGDYCFLGSGAVLQPGLKIGDNITVGAGAIVTKNFDESGLVIAGAPAKVIKKAGKGEPLKGIPVIPNPQEDSV